MAASSVGYYICGGFKQENTIYCSELAKHEKLNSRIAYYGGT